MLAIAIIVPTFEADISGADYYTWAAMLYTIASIVDGASTWMVWARLGARRAPIRLPWRETCHACAISIKERANGSSACTQLLVVGL